eukprot:1034075-Pyramimonas_sp.AAC.1
MEIAEKGIGPENGFYGEPLGRGSSLRARLCGRQLAGGRDLNALRLFSPPRPSPFLAPPLRGGQGNGPRANPPFSFRGGFRACYVGTKHDTKAKKELHAEENWWATSWMCNDCFACKPSKKTPRGLEYGDFRATAPWRGTVLSDEAHLRLYGATSPASRVLRSARRPRSLLE